MPNYLAPGVYVQEVPSGARSIGRVNTSIAAFIGVAPMASARLDEAVVIDNYTQFADMYVGESTAGTALANAVYGFFDEGGGRCYVVNIGLNGSLTGTSAKPTGLKLLEAIDDISMVAAPGYADPAAYAALIGHCEHPLRQDRMAILDTVEVVDDVSALTRVGTVGDSDSAPGGDSSASTGSGHDTAPDGGDADSGSSPPTPPAKKVPAAELALGAPQSPGGYAALYYPWIRVKDVVTGNLVNQPPSGHVAGVWARVDNSRGVHKAPANEPIRNALGLVRRISRGEQEVLNPAGVNCIRYFPTEGTLVWGTRTRAAEASPYRYIPVRRLTNMIKESIADGTRWCLFEPNGFELWRSIHREISAFLTGVWRDGGLLGRTPQEAFFVQCDATTNPPDVRDAGQVIAIVGIAPVKPAEFVIFKVMQSADITEIQNVGA
ncbi:phage tail sheath subtilisin-like domain-containing protein [Arthrobacter sp. H35-D1]|uniref:phage tail sheath family protein n=1 Tax=Arthrobacter sp. H35-D1 TaxID=3046202 RepID=UPI0024BAAE1A|nr:phage tail sheath subtilisin-like domain-containing protein [Arthrobacter sp. H35-D1]MDJ0313091.1 phage tail sheath subtilisin-like domain-containing protein [Arthrobacter sp. H35-D1]